MFNHRIQRRLFAVTVWILLATAPVKAAEEAPATLQGATVITAERTKQLLEKGTLVVDTRVANEYAESHIKGAINIPYKEKSAKSVKFDMAQDSFDLHRLPGDKTQPIVFYCNSGECWKSYKASVAAIKVGYRQVYWFRGGYPEWKAKGYPVK